MEGTGAHLLHSRHRLGTSLLLGVLLERSAAAGNRCTATRHRRTKCHQTKCGRRRNSPLAGILLHYRLLQALVDGVIFCKLCRSHTIRVLFSFSQSAVCGGS